MAQPSKGKNSKDPSMKHLDRKSSTTASSNDYTGSIPANPQQAEDKQYPRTK